MSTNVTLVGIYDYRLVALSVFIAIIAAYAALDLASRITTAQGTTRLAWLSSGAIAMGTGIWAMHYVGMAALTLPVPVLYDWPTVVLSALTAIVASGIALFVVSRPTMSPATTMAGSIFMGGGIAAMHYIGMAAMRMPAMCLYSPWLVTLSIVLAIGISYTALTLQFAFRSQAASWSARKFGSAILLGAAIPVMHYVGMAAVTLMPGAMTGTMRHAAHLSTLGLARIIVLTLFTLALVILTSVLDRRRAAHFRELAESRQQLQTIFDNMNDGIVVLDLQRNVVHANHTAVKLLGPMHRNLTNAEGAEIYQVLLPNGQFLPRDQWPSAKAVRGEFIDNVEFIIRRKDEGKEIVAEITTTPIMNAEGETIQVIVTYRDVSVLKLNMDTRARLAAIVESSEDAIIGKDDTGIVRSWNDAAEKIFGYTAEEMIGQSILRLLPAGHEQEESEFLYHLKRGEVVDHVETVRKTKSGKLIHVSLTISPIRDASGKVVGASKMARDITQRKQLERQLQQSQKMEAIGQLTGGIAHDFNNLLAVIVGNLSLLERMIGENEAVAKRLRPAQRAAARGADLTRRLLAFSSAEELQPAPTKLSHSIRNTIELATRTLGPEIKIVTKLDENIPPVFVDPAGLENALLNLAVNARDAMPRGGSLTITTELVNLEENYPPVKTGELKPGRYACVSVTDTGEGMSRETMERALEPFFTTKPRGKGTGLGLAMVYGFVKQSGGAIRLYSEVGYGTTVTFYLQLAKTVAKAPAAVVEHHAASTRGGKVLVVDDEVDLLDIAVAYLEQMGYTAFQAVDGASALALIDRERDIALVITDVIMPGGMNGAELVKKIRQLLPAIKVIYSSGFPADALSERSGTVVEGLLLHKPYQRAEFDAMVHRALEETESDAGHATQLQPERNRRVRGRRRDDTENFDH
jgi:PAS domain S-box-containing protein